MIIVEALAIEGFVNRTIGNAVGVVGDVPLFLRRCTLRISPKLFPSIHE
jgi:hypothetical protein